VITIIEIVTFSETQNEHSSLQELIKIPKSLAAEDPTSFQNKQR
jgi:hypothetical protein